MCVQVEGEEGEMTVKKRKRSFGWRKRKSVLIEEGEEEEQLQEVCVCEVVSECVS